MDQVPVQIERAVHRALCRYARSLDERRWEMLDEVFADDCIASYGDDDPRRGRADIVAGIRKYLDRCGPTQHLLGNLEVDAADGRILSRCYVRAAHAPPPGRDGGTFMTWGEYRAVWAADGTSVRAIKWEMRVTFNHGDASLLFDSDL